MSITDTYAFADGLFVASKQVKTEKEGLGEIEHQRNSWINALENLSMRLEGDVSGAVIEMHRRLKAETHVFRMRLTSQNGILVSGPILLFAADDHHEALRSADPLSVLAVILVEAGSSPLGVEFPLGFDLIYHVSGYRGHKVAQARAENMIREMKDDRERLRNEKLIEPNFYKELLELKSTLAEDQRAALANLKAEFEGFSRKVQSQGYEFNSALVGWQEQIDAAAKSSVEAGLLGEAIQVWTYKAKTHSRFFRWLLGGVFVLASVVIVSLPVLWIEYGSYITRTASGDVAYADLIVVLATLGAIIWLARILVRLVFTERTLGDDAVQRRAFLETYLRLVATPTPRWKPTTGFSC
jgi:hypothetical protein